MKIKEYILAATFLMAGCVKEMPVIYQNYAPAKGYDIMTLYSKVQKDSIVFQLVLIGELNDNLKSFKLETGLINAIDGNGDGKVDELYKTGIPQGSELEKIANKESVANIIKELRKKKK